MNDDQSTAVPGVADPAPNDPRLEEPTLVSVDGITLGDELGRGGFGVVHKGTDGKRPVAVKTLNPKHLVGNQADQALRRWRAECDRVATLKGHEHRVEIYPTAEAHYSNGTTLPALVMELLEGAQPLREFVNNRDRRCRVGLLADLCLGVESLNGAHSDLKPDNALVIEEDGKPIVKLVDFGGYRIAGHYQGEVPERTLKYASPEQNTSANGIVDRLSDVYALSKMGYELVCGTQAIDVVGRQDRQAHASWIPRPLTDFLPVGDARLERVLRKAVQIDREQRAPKSAGQLGALLEQANRPNWQDWLLTIGKLLNAEGWRGWASRLIVVLALATVASMLAIRMAKGVVLAGGPLRPTMAMLLFEGESLDHVRIARLHDPAQLERLRELLPEFAARLDANPADITAFRILWDAVVRRAADLGVEVVALDLEFPSQSPGGRTSGDMHELDRIMLAAIDYARDRGTEVIIGQSRDPAPPHENFKHVPIGHFVLWSFLAEGMQVCTVVTEDGMVIVPLPVQAFAARSFPLLARGFAEVDGPALAIRSQGEPQRKVPAFMDLTVADATRTDAAIEAELRAWTMLDAGDRLLRHRFPVPSRAILRAAEIDLIDLLDPEREAEVKLALAGRILFVANNIAIGDGTEALVPTDYWSHSFRTDETELPRGNFNKETAPAWAGVKRLWPGVWFMAAAAEHFLRGGRQYSPPTAQWAAASVFAAALGLFVPWWIGAVIAKRTPRAAGDARCHKRGWGIDAAWLVAATVVLALVLFGAPLWPFAMPYTMGVLIVSVALGLLFGIGLALRAALSRDLQQSFLRPRSHAW